MASPAPAPSAPPAPDPRAGDPVLRATDLTRSYGRGQARLDALKGVSLDVLRGESLAVVGKSGSGKSTLMHLLALLDRPSTGTIEVDGRDVARASTAEVNRLRNRRFGFVFQQFFLTAGQTVLENVSLPLVIAGVPARERTRRALEALDALGLSDKARNRANDLSGGQKQRVVIARALVNEPDVIFADEPTGNLDSTTSAEILELLRQSVSDYGQTTVMVTHDASAAAIADRVLFLADGCIVKELRNAAAHDILSAMEEVSRS
jgi:putative ABC transport system ATP-binding protein